ATAIPHTLRGQLPRINDPHHGGTTYPEQVRRLLGGECHRLWDDRHCPTMLHGVDDLSERPVYRLGQFYLFALVSPDEEVARCDRASSCLVSIEEAVDLRQAWRVARQVRLLQRVAHDIP